MKNRLEAEREAADKIVQARNAEEAKAQEFNRGIINDAHAAIGERQAAQRTQRLADFAKGEYGSLDELLVAARKM